MTLRAEQINYIFLRECNDYDRINNILSTQYSNIFGTTTFVPERTKLFSIIGATNFGPEYIEIEIGVFLVTDKQIINQKYLDLIIHEEYRKHGFATIAYNMISNIYNSFGIELYMWCDINNNPAHKFWNSIKTIQYLGSDENNDLFMDQNFNKTQYFNPNV